MVEEIQVNVEDGETFFADEVSVIHNPVRIVIDFKSITPRIDVKPSQIRLRMKHNTIVLDPQLAKDFLKALTTNIANFEKRFGIIKKLKSVELAQQEAKQKIVTKSKGLKKQDYF